MLSLVGLGLDNEKDLTLRAVEEAKKADKIYIELYTDIWFGKIKNLEKILKRKVFLLQRKDLEEDSKKILEEAKEKNVLVFVPGDPLVATTHSSLILEAKNLRIKTKVIHNASIVSAIAETGLHLQKFGPFITVPFLERTKNELPESVYDVIKANKERGLHTLCLLDIDKERNKFMSLNEAFEILLKLEEKRKENVFTEDSSAIVFAKAGSEKSFMAYGKIKELIKKNFKDLPMVFILPGMLHYSEKEFLEAIS